jgi:toxin CptA
MKSAPTIAFDYRPSRIVAIAAATVAALALAAPLLSGLPLVLRAALALLALLAGLASIRRFLRPRLRRVAHGATGWQLVDGDEAREATLLSHARIGAFIALSWRLADGERRHAVLAPDNIDADTRRRVALLLLRADVVAADAHAAQPRE